MSTEDYNDLLDGDEVHNDDIVVLGPAIDAVNFIRVNYANIAKRNIGYLRERIARRKTREREELRSEFAKVVIAANAEDSPELRQARETYLAAEETLTREINRLTPVV